MVTATIKWIRMDNQRQMLLLVFPLEDQFLFILRTCMWLVSYILANKTTVSHHCTTLWRTQPTCVAKPQCDFLLSFPSLSRLPVMHITYWLNAYSIIKLFLFCLSGESLLVWKKIFYFFNAYFPKSSPSSIFSAIN